MVLEITNTDRGLSDTEIRVLLAEGLGSLDLEGRRVLVVIPDGTRTASSTRTARIVHASGSGSVSPSGSRRSMRREPSPPTASNV